jgi:methylmalonyl-CoA mutase cobalamin-binding domain/chain
VRDVGYHLSYLSEAMAASDPSLFADYAAWVKVLFAGLHFPDQVLPTTLQCIGDVLQEMLPEELKAIANEYLEAGLRQLAQAPSALPTCISQDAPWADLATEYLKALLRGERHVASRLILEAVDRGVPIKDLYLHVFQRSQHEIGRLWQMNQISVAREHYCTAATQWIMSQLYPHIFATERIGRRLVATCVGGELHEIGLRMVADFFEMAGWDTYYLGANTPTESVVRAVAEREADVLGVSATLTFHVSAVADLIANVRASEAGDVKILAGGYPFNIAPDLWRQVGALGCLLKDSEPEDLVRSVRQVHRGEPSLHPSTARKVLEELSQPTPRKPAPEPLTEREVEVLRLLAKGLGNQEIADQLVIAEVTVRTHVSNILSKLHLANRVQATLYALREGLTSLDDNAQGDT